MVDLKTLLTINAQVVSSASSRLANTFNGYKSWLADYRSGSKKYEEHLKGMTDYKLSEDEAILILAYTGTRSGWLNGELRHGKKESSQDILLYRDYLSFVLNKIPAYNNNLVYRMEYEVYDEEAELNWFKSKIGSVFELPYFLSTGKEDKGNAPVVWQIETLRQGSLGRDIANLTNNKGELEVLFNRNSKFLIKGIDRKKNYIYLEEVDQATEANFELTGIYCKNIK